MKENWASVMSKGGNLTKMKKENQTLEEHEKDCGLCNPSGKEQTAEDKKEIMRNLRGIIKDIRAERAQLLKEQRKFRIQLDKLRGII